jgi:DNA mismatch repair protein MutL
VASRIAAGEVIERPASIVRELLDNAIDAGATRISVTIEGGGVDLIRITDDGCGIGPEDVELAFERHATSKIAAITDLAAVRTLGFRGEALPSIAAAADVELTTRSRTEPVGTYAVLVEGRVVRRQAKPAPPGTTFAVRDLFARLPARRKFLNAAPAEHRTITTLVAHYALAYPGIAFELVAGGRTAMRTGGDGDLRHAFAAVFGAATAAEMLTVDHREDGVTVSGLCSPPALHRGNRSGVSAFVNGRWVQSRPLTFAVVDAYQSQLPVGRFPVVAVSLALSADDLDVNVHPAKAEVRFRDERAVMRAVRHAVSSALEGAAPASWLPRPAAAAPGPWTSPAPAAGTSMAAPSPLRGPAPLQASLALSTAGAVPSQGGRHRDLIPLLRVVGQLANTYVIAEGPDGMYLVDQHAAHERVVFDRLVSRGGAPAPASQPLLEPVLVELGVAGTATLMEHMDHLRACGLDIEAFGEGTCLVRGVPPGFGESGVAATMAGLLDRLGAERRVTEPFGRAAATVACHSSVRAGMALATEEMRRLLDDLARTETPRTCPHGRPTLVHVGTDLIERQFGR